MRHFAAAKAHGHFDLVAFTQKFPRRTHLDVIVVDIDARPHFDLLDVDRSLLLARLILLFLGLVLEFAVVKDLAHRRIALGCNLDEVEAPVLGLSEGLINRHDSENRAIGIDQTHRCRANILIDRPVISDRRLKKWRSCYGYISLVASLPSSSAASHGRTASFINKSIDRIVQCKVFLLLATKSPHRYLATGNLGGANDKHHGRFSDAMLAHFVAYFLVA